MRASSELPCAGTSSASDDQRGRAAESRGTSSRLPRRSRRRRSVPRRRCRCGAHHPPGRTELGWSGWFVWTSGRGEPSAARSGGYRDVAISRLERSRQKAAETGSSAPAPGRNSVVSNPKRPAKPLPRTPKPPRVLTFREGHTPDIESHLPAVTEPRPGECCVPCNEPAGKVVLGPIERVSGLRRRTPVCAKCANSRLGRSRRWR